MKRQMKMRLGWTVALLAAGYPVLAQHQPLWNTPTNPQPEQQAVAVEQAGVTQVQYAPQRPPAISNPGILEAPELVARELNETDQGYTARMTRKLEQEQTRTQALMRRHDEMLDRLRNGLPVDAYR